MEDHAQGGILAGSSQEIIKTHRKSLLELPFLTFSVEMLSGFPVKKNKFFFFFPVHFRKYTLHIFFLPFFWFLLMQFPAKYPPDPVGSPEAKIKSHPDHAEQCRIHIMVREPS
jgi:hypothetical protein